MFQRISSLIFKRTIRNSLALPQQIDSSKGSCRCYCDEKREGNQGKPSVHKENKTNQNQDEFVQPGLESKYSLFKDADAPILLDVYEEKLLGEMEPEPTIEEFRGVSLKRGTAGVFDIDDLVELLKRDKAENICVIEVPPEARYVDHIVVVTGRSRRHMIALAEIVRRVFKKKKDSTDIIPRIEGEGSAMWMALDLGNIALHIFSQDARGYYDLESLWSVGAEYDSLSNSVEDPLIALLKKHSISLNDVTSKG